MIRRAMFMRVSTDEQEEEQQQDPILIEFKLDESDFQYILKEKISAWNLEKESKRVSFLKLRDLVDKNLIDEIYVFDIDRIYRNRKKLVEFYSFCKYKNVKIYSVNQKYLNDLLYIQMPPGLEFFSEQIFSNTLNLLGWVAEDESIRKSNKIKKAVVKKEGKPTTSKYGNKWGAKSLSKQITNKVLDLHKEGLSQRKIQERVWIYDEHGNKKKNISLGKVNSIINSVQKSSTQNSQ